MDYPFRSQQIIVIRNIDSVQVVSADPDAVIAKERSLVSIHEGRAETVIGLEVRVGPVVVRGVGTELIVGRYVRGEVPGRGQGEKVGVLEDEILSASTGLREPD